MRSAQVIAFDPEHDAALLRPAAALAGPGLTLREAEARRGEALAAVGYPLWSETIRVSEGLVSGLPVSVDSANQHVERAFVTDAATNGGNSGGPVIDMAGQVLGLVSGGRDWDSDDADSRRPVQGTDYIVPAADLSALARATATTAPDLELAVCEFDMMDQDERGEVEDEFALDVRSTSVWATAAAHTLYLHGTAINRSDYPSAWNLFTPRAQQSLGTIESWADGLATSVWTKLTIVLVDTVPDTLTVDALVTTRQDPSQSSQGNACSEWTMVYTLRLADGVWLIDKVKGTEKPCP